MKGMFADYYYFNNNNNNVVGRTILSIPTDPKRIEMSASGRGEERSRGTEERTELRGGGA